MHFYATPTLGFYGIHILYECKFILEYCLALYRIIWDQLDGKESCLVGYHTANTIMRDCALSLCGIQLIMDAPSILIL